SRRRHTRLQGDWSSDVCSSDLMTIRVKVITTAAILIVLPGAMSNCLAQSGDSGGKQLSVERIYSQPSLSGRLLSGMTWMPDGARSEERRVGKECRCGWGQAMCK